MQKNISPIWDAQTKKLSENLLKRPLTMREIKTLNVCSSHKWTTTDAIELIISCELAKDSKNILNKLHKGVV